MNYDDWEGADWVGWLFFWLVILVGIELTQGCSRPPSEAEEPKLKKSSTFAIGGQHPAVGFLRFYLPDGRAVDCTGTLVAPDKVLTASHCIPSLMHRASMREVGLFVVGGAMHRISDVRAANFIYGGPSPSDVSLLRLHKPSNVEPMRVAHSYPSPGAELTMVGFSRLCGAIPPLSARIYRWKPKAVDLGAMPLRGRGSPKICNGDSGGPLYSRDGVIGVVSGVRITHDRFEVGIFGDVVSVSPYTGIP